MARLHLLLLPCLAAACADLTALPDPVPPAAVSPLGGTAATGRATETRPLSLDRSVCGPGAPLALDPRCVAIAEPRAAAPDSTDWGRVGRDTAAARSDLIELRDRQARLARDPGAALPGERQALAREEIRLEQQLQRAPRDRLQTAPRSLGGF